MHLFRTLRSFVKSISERIGEKVEKINLKEQMMAIHSKIMILLVKNAKCRNYCTN